MAILYKHIRNDTKEVFYIGIGSTAKRAFCKKSRNPYWHHVVNKAGYSVEILFEDLGWEEACAKERQLIKEYGRKDLGLGNLVNQTDGGEGVTGLTHSEELKARIRARRTGVIASEETRKRMSEAVKGRPKSEEWKKKMSELKKGKKCPAVSEANKKRVGMKFKKKQLQ